MVEGVYIPFDWYHDFSEDYLQAIQYYCLIMTHNYIEQNFGIIKAHANVIETRQDESFYTKQRLIQDNEANLIMCKEYGCQYVLIEDDYQTILELDF